MDDLYLKLSVLERRIDESDAAHEILGIALVSKLDEVRGSINDLTKALNTQIKRNEFQDADLERLKKQVYDSARNTSSAWGAAVAGVVSFMIQVFQYLT